MKATKKNISYKDLAPVDNISDENTYIEALDWAINNSRIKNIALAGPYGSGKSSVIQSFINSHSFLKTVNVSLAEFQENTSDDKTSGLENSIEEGILKQLFYSVRHEDIPQSRYRKLHRIGHIVPMINIGICSFLVALLSYVFFPEKFSNFINLIFQAGHKHNLSDRYIVLLLLVVLLILISLLAKLYRILPGKITLKEIKLPVNATVASGNDREDSVFNRNLDEIIYYFEEMQYDVVFFEDLDRLDNADIFVKLRELNILLNNNASIKKAVKFVYAVKDDIFTNTDRTKFFEFIIPIVPVINSTNSGETLTQLIRESQVAVNISTEYVMNISPFISDMRLLLNAYNEFLIYKKTLQTGQSLNLNDQAMLSLVIFKNLYPKEFADLQAEKGIIKEAFSTCKSSIINKIRDELQETIDSSKKILEEISNDALKSRHELVGAFLCELTGWKGYATSISVNGTRYNYNEMWRDDFDFNKINNEVKENKFVTIEYIKWGESYRRSYNPSNIATMFAEYSKRFEYIDLLEKNKVEELREKIEINNQKIYSINTYSLKQLIEEFNVEAVLPSNIRENRTLVYMLRMGYIDERYADYINYFKGTSITTADMNFVLSVKNREALQFNYKLTKIDQIIDRLQPYEFEQEEILNFQLLEHMLGSDAYKEKRKRFLQKISDGSEKSWRFLSEFSEQTVHNSVLFCEISSVWPKMWDYIFDNVVLTHEKKTHYLVMILKYADVKDIIKQDFSGKLSLYLTSSISTLEELNDVPVEKLIAVIDALKVRFKDVKLTGINKKVADFVIDNSCYEICLPMFQRILEVKNPELLSMSKVQNYTTLCRLDYGPVLDYVHKNWDKYVHEIILSEENVEETNESVLMLLEKSITDMNLCTNLISHQCCIIDDLKKCEFEGLINNKTAIEPLWNQLLIENKLTPVWSNVNLYWTRFSLSEVLLHYVERNADILVDDSETDVNELFISEYLTSSGNNDAYKILTKRLKLHEFIIPITKIPKDRLAILIENHYFTYSVKLYNQIHSAYPDLAISVILQNQSEFIVSIDEITMDHEEVIRIIRSVDASKKLKDTIINYFGETIMSEEIAKELCAFSYDINKEVFTSAWKHLDENGRKTLLYRYLPILNAKDFEQCFQDVGMFNSLCTRVRHNVELPDDQQNELLAKRLEEVEYITSWKHEKEAYKIHCGKETKTKYKSVIICVVKTEKPKS